AYYNGVYATGSSARVAKDNAKKNSNYQENVSYIYERETRAVIRKTRDARANKHKLAQKYSKYSQKPNDSSECDSHKSY
ncbi:hypothetical protein, partial [Vibrio parahaemolyticus]|uniref:hypothetical protein n=1 Tax=Vibrio parahaemolyticus TaxID=670 RepID=UPI001C5F0510